MIVALALCLVSCCRNRKAKRARAEAAEATCISSTFVEKEAQTPETAGKIVTNVPTADIADSTYQDVQTGLIAEKQDTNDYAVGLPVNSVNGK